MSTRTVYEETAMPLSDSATEAALSAYYWQIEQVLEGIENSLTYYQCLGIGRSATKEQISQAYRHILKSLHPSRKPPGFSIPLEMQERIRQAIEKISLAGATLLSFGKRVQYDNSLSRRATAPLPINRAGLPARAEAAAAPPASQEPTATLARDSRTVLLEEGAGRQPIATQKPIGTVLNEEKAGQDRRRVPRLKLAIPVYVTGHDRQAGKWREIARTVNVSRVGVAIAMRTAMPQGTVLHLSLPLPVKLRNHGYSDATYNVFAIVRRVRQPKDGLRIVGVELLGERPPAGYVEQPWAIFSTTKWLGVDRRREQRQSCNEPVGVEYLDQENQIIGSELAAAENISYGGMRVLVKTAPAVFDSIRVTSLTTHHSSQATVCHRYAGKDGCERLCLNFIDAKWPL